MFTLALLWVAISGNAVGKVDLKTVATWQHDKLFGGKRFGTIVDADGALIGQFQKDLPFMMTSETLTDLRPRGQGPGDLVSVFGIGFRDQDLIVVEWTGKIKAFTKVNGAYEPKGSIHRKVENSALQIDDFAWVGDRFFIAGFAMEPTVEKDKFAFVSLKSYSRDGAFLGNLVTLLEEKEAFSVHNNWLERHLKTDGETLFFMMENNLDLHIIDPADPKANHRIVTLERPPSYQPMPDSFFHIFEKNGRLMDGAAISYKTVEWRKGYSRVENMEILAEHVVLQIRTAHEGIPRFALCFYEKSEKPALVGLTYTDDLLLGSLGDRLYMMAGGHPGIDDVELENTIVNIVTPVFP